MMTLWVVCMSFTDVIKSVLPSTDIIYLEGRERAFHDLGNHDLGKHLFFNALAEIYCHTVYTKITTNCCKCIINCETLYNVSALILQLQRKYFFYNAMRYNLTLCIFYEILKTE